MSILVCGGAGYVGSHCLEALKAAGYDCVVVDDLSRGHRAAVGESPLYVGNIADDALMDRVFREHHIEVVLHFAAASQVGESMNTEDYRIRDSFRLAEEAGIEYHFVPCTENKGYHPNTVEVIITNEEGTTTSILGVSVGGGNVKLKQINGADISVSGNLTTLFVQQYDRPGVVAHISKCLTDYNVNIAFMKLYRDKKGENAYTIIETDEALPDKLVQEINDYPDIKSAIVIDL